MLEIIALLVLTGMIGDMARRRRRSSNLFGLMLFACWFGGEIAGGVLGYVLTVAAGRPPNLGLIYGPALGGAICGAVVAFVVAKSLAPVDGGWKDLAEYPVRRSRLLGAVIGGVGGGAAGALVIWFMYGQTAGNLGNLPMAFQGFLAVGLVGALLGLVSGLQKN